MVTLSPESGIDVVTGGTGFIGAHIVRALLGRGRRVRCLVRPGSRRSNLDSLQVELAEGDLRDRQSLAAALRGTHTLYHCAADYRLWSRDPGELYQTNVEGTRNILTIAAELGLERAVYTSSVSCIGLEPDGSPSTEETPIHPGDLVGHYKKSKHEAETVALSVAAGGFPVVIVNPSTPVGELDIKPTPTGKIIVDFLNGKIPAYVQTGMNFIDVRDVASGHLLAAERGTSGQRYILGNTNLSLKQLLDRLAALSGRKAPSVRLPHIVPMAFAVLDTAFSKIVGRQPGVTIDSVKMSKHMMYFDASKAIGELGLPQTAIDEALGRAIQWFRANGYVRASHA